MTQHTPTGKDCPVPEKQGKRHRDRLVLLSAVSEFKIFVLVTDPKDHQA